MLSFFLPNKKNNEAEEDSKSNAIPLDPFNLKNCGDIDNPLSAVECVGPQVYRIKGTCYYLIGCQGEGEESQKQVAECIIEAIKSDPHNRPAFILVLGDNFYPRGVSSPYDPAFNTQFYNMYSELEKYNIPLFLILGNHDVIRYEGSRFKSDADKDKTVGVNQAAHHYLPKSNKFASTAEIAQTFTPRKKGEMVSLSLKKCQLFNLPYYYYSLVLEQTNEQIFCLNSNSILREFLAWKRNRAQCNEYNQVAWLLKTYTQAVLAKRDVTIAMHHPLRTVGKRAHATEFDSDHYLAPQEIIELNQIFGTDTDSYNELLKALFDYLKISFKKLYVAHDHFISIDDDKDFVQLTNGAGGGGLHAQKSFLRYPHTKYHLEKFGFAIHDGNTLELRSTTGHRVVYDYKKHLPVRRLSDKQSEDIRRTLLNALRQYYQMLKELESTHMDNTRSHQEIDMGKDESYVSFSHKVFRLMVRAKNKIVDYWLQDTKRTQEIECANNLKVYLDRPQLASLNDIYDYLTQILVSLPNQENTDSLFSIIREHCESVGLLTDVFENVAALNDPSYVRLP